MIDTATMRAVGALRRDYDGAQDHDFILRCSELLDHALIHHVPELLYHWRITPGSTAADISNKLYAVDAGVAAVRDHLERIGKPARVSSINGSPSTASSGSPSTSRASRSSSRSATRSAPRGGASPA